MMVVGLVERVEHLPSREISCENMEDVGNELLKLKALGYSAAQVRYYIDTSFYIAMRGEEAMIISGDMSGSVSPNGYQKEDKLRLIVSDLGAPYLYLGGLDKVTSDLVYNGGCWIYEGNPATVKLFFLLKKKYLPVSRKIPEIIKNSERRVCVAMEQTLQSAL